MKKVKPSLASLKRALSDTRLPLIPATRVNEAREVLQKIEEAYGQAEKVVASKGVEEQTYPCDEDLKMLVKEATIVLTAVNCSLKMHKAT